MSENTIEETAVQNDAVLDTASIDGSSVAGEIQSLIENRPLMFSSVRSNSFADKVAVVNALSASEPVKEHIGEVLPVKDVVIQGVTMLNRATGEVNEQPRIVLLTSDGKAYHAISQGLFRSVKNILTILGHPNGWPEPVPFVVSEVAGRGSNTYFTATIDTSSPKASKGK